MSYLVTNPEDRFSRDEAHFVCMQAVMILTRLVFVVLQSATIMILSFWIDRSGETVVDPDQIAPDHFVQVFP